jgi:hypothetical protein
VKRILHAFSKTQFMGYSVEKRLGFFGAGVFIIGISLLITCISNQFQGFEGWLSFLVILVLSISIAFSGWSLLKRDRQLNLPRTLFWLFLGAIFLRMLVGAFWVIALPEWGHDTAIQRAGYVMEDAHSRDTVAWELAHSEVGLWAAFRDYPDVDQYGGLLFLSAFIYRYIGGEVHHPLLIVLFTASFSSLAVVFTWAFARRSWNEGVAWLAAIFLAVYPEAVLLGSSQMREAFTITLVSIAFYGLLRYWQERSAVSMGWILAPLVLTLPFSPAFTVVLLAMLAVLGLALGEWRISHDRRFWMILVAIVILAVLGVWISWRQIAPEGMSNPIAVLTWWITKSAEWQFYLTERSSGWIQRILAETPEWMNVPLITLYGVVRPFLPAALIATSEAPIWTAISIWRSLGWTILLPFLLYTPFRALRQQEGRGLLIGLCLVVWAGILIASFRGGGDMWDNPRYRVVFSSMQVLLVAWLWHEQNLQKDAWLWRIIIAFFVSLVWFIPWYVSRYYPTFNWPISDFFLTLGLALVSALLYVIWDLRRSSNVK